MKRMTHALVVSLAFVLVGGLNGCASAVKDRKSGGDFDNLYDGESQVRFATMLPVSSPEEAAKRGDAALAEGDYDRALFEYIRALELDNEQPDILQKIGAIHAERDNPRLAETAFRMALKLDPEHARAALGLGLLLLDERHYRDAARYLRMAVAANEGTWRARNGLGIIADLDGRHDVAVVHYELALKTRGRSPRILNNLGYSKYLAGDWAGALTAFRKAVSVDPDYERAWHNMALVYAMQGQYDRAISAFERTMDRASAYNNVGYICLRNDQRETARKYLEKAAELRPSYYRKAFENLDLTMAAGHAR